MKTVIRKFLVVTLVVASLPLIGCHRTKTYEANVQVTRVHATRKDEAGNPLTTDLEFTFVECPGTQVEVVRGGKEFSDCVKKLNAGDKVKVKLVHKWDAEGFYDHDVVQVNECKRPPDPNDEASYKMVRDCSDWNVNGARVGFQCNYADKKDLNKKCPWFSKH